MRNRNLRPLNWQTYNTHGEAKASSRVIAAHCRLTPLQGTRANIRINLILQETTVHGHGPILEGFSATSEGFHVDVMWKASVQGDCDIDYNGRCHNLSRC